MSEKRGTSSVAALMIARAAQRLAQHNDDAEMQAEAKEYESRTMDAIRQHLPELPPLEKPPRERLD
jgi:protein involved in polysaccharide export with SLBB domain